MKHLNTTSEVIDALGGNAPVGRICGCSSKVVSNWRNGLFPAKTYLALQAALTEGKNKGKFYAPDSLWTMIPVPQKRSA